MDYAYTNSGTKVHILKYGLTWCGHTPGWKVMTPPPRQPSRESLCKRCVHNRSLHRKEQA